MAENCENDRRIRGEAAVERQARMLEVRKHDYLELDPSFITFTHVFQGFHAAFCSREPVHHHKNISTNGEPIFTPVLA